MGTRRQSRKRKWFCLRPPDFLRGYENIMDCKADEKRNREERRHGILSDKWRKEVF